MPIERYVYASSSSVYGDRRAAADAGRHVSAAAVALRRDQAGSRAPGQPLLREPRRPGGLAAVFHGLRATPAARHGVSPVPDGRAATARPITVYGDGEQTRDFTFVADIVAANIAAARPGASGQRVQYWWWLPGHAEPGARADWPVTGKTGEHSARTRSERRHAPYLRRHVAARRDLDFAPRVTLENGLEQQYRWLTTMKHSRFFALLLPALCSSLALSAGLRLEPARDGRARRRGQILLDRGNAALKERKWTTRAQYFSELLESYPQSPLRAEAKLGVGDTYLGENNSGVLRVRPERIPRISRVLSDEPARRLRADAARDGAFQPDAEPAARPDRDQGGHSEFEMFSTAIPNSPLMPEVKQRFERRRIGCPTADLQVGNFYLEHPAVPGGR